MHLAGFQKCVASANSRNTAVADTIQTCSIKEIVFYLGRAL